MEYQEDVFGRPDPFPPLAVSIRKFAAPYSWRRQREKEREREQREREKKKEDLALGKRKKKEI